MGLSVNQYINSILEEDSIDKKLTNSNLKAKDDKLIEIIKKSSLFENLEGIILFGSVAKKIDTANSDLDLLLVMRQGTKINRSLYTTWDNEVENKLTKDITKGKEVSPHFVELPNNLDQVHSLWLEVSISGIPLWERNSNINSILEKIRLSIAENEFTRKNTHGQPYWIRKNSLDTL
jgi:predicted nucleotidyltransferase